MVLVRQPTITARAEAMVSGVDDLEPDPSTGPLQNAEGPVQPPQFERHLVRHRAAVAEQHPALGPFPEEEGRDGHAQADAEDRGLIRGPGGACEAPETGEGPSGAVGE